MGHGAALQLYLAALENQPCGFDHTRVVDHAVECAFDLPRRHGDRRGGLHAARIVKIDLERCVFNPCPDQAVAGHIHRHCVARRQGDVGGKQQAVVLNIVAH